MKNKTVKPLMQAGVPLGVDRNTTFTEKSVELTSGDTLILFSDGVIEAEKAGKTYGIKRLQKLIWEKHEMPAKELASEVIQDALRFCAQPRPEDDMTSIVMKLA